MNNLNVQNRTLFHGDNLPVLKGINSASIDLIATDPPFQKGRDFHATPGSLASGASFQDRWRWEPEHSQWQQEVADAGWPQVADLIETARTCHSDDMGAFLAFMAVREIEFKRILKPTGSHFLHCDPTASHYLKMLLDGIFGVEQFRNEIVWCYYGPGFVKRHFPRKHDIILFYAGENAVFNKEEMRVPYADATWARSKYEGKPGASVKLTNRTPKHWGKVVEDWWSDIGSGKDLSKKERTGYPTQKPLKLYDRIIQATTNRDDVVLDPFAGCATTCVAAERAGRRWVGIDLWDKTYEVTLERLEREGLAVAGTEPVSGTLTFADIHYKTAPPRRNDQLDAAAVPVLVTPEGKPAASGRLSGRLKAELKIRLIQEGGLECAGCDRTLPHEDYLDIDHRLPVSDGGTNEFSNLCLLCQPCNRLKSNTFTLTGLRRENKKRRFMADQQPAHRQPQVIAAV